MSALEGEGRADRVFARTYSESTVFLFIVINTFSNIIFVFGMYNDMSDEREFHVFKSFILCLFSSFFQVLTNLILWLYV